ncbi:MAG: helix-turn-helix domain-containing protein [Acidobacteriota bacterium]
MPLTKRAPSPLPTLYSIRETADLLKVSTKTIRRWIESGELPAHRLGRQIRISEDDLLTFIRTRRQA